MYANEPLVLELMSLLRSHEVKHIVISPGSRHYAFTRSFENDDYFSLYSIVDERSAAFFALGLIQATGESAAVICTSGTASINYGSAIAEAYYQKLPLVAITADRLPDFLHQMEDQMLDQRQLFEGFVRLTVQLRPITSERDRWYCNRVINEALLEAQDEGGGPVHINVPIESHTNVQFDTVALPDARVIKRHRPGADEGAWSDIASRLTGKRVLLMWGQTAEVSERTLTALTSFASILDVSVFADHLSNVHHPIRVTNPLGLLKSLSPSSTEMRPDIVITLGGNIVFKEESKSYLAGVDFEHWRVDSDGKVSDLYRKLTDVIATKPYVFFEQVVAASESVEEEHTFAKRMLNAGSSIDSPKASYGELAIIGELMKRLPVNSALHIANSAPIRMTQLYPLDSSIAVFCNRGVNGIDGCMSTAIGYAAARPDRQVFLIIGDLTFFYDMNSLWNRHLPTNLRILLINNDGGAIMHSPLPKDYNDRASRHVSAGHHTSAQGWIESLGLAYSSARTAGDAASQLDWLVNPSADESRVVEVFTEKVSDIQQLRSYYGRLHEVTGAQRFKGRARRSVGRVLRTLHLR